MSESLIIEGKQYISARRAAEIAEYSKDYVGQLCRSGKLVCRMVGRFWYIDEKSLRKHKDESFKYNQTSFGANGFLAKASTANNSVNSSISADMVSVQYPFVSALKQTVFVFIAIVAILVGGVMAVSIGKPFLPQTLSLKFPSTVIDNSASVYSVMNAAGGVLQSFFDQTYSGIVSIVSPQPKSNIIVPLAVSTSTGDTDQSDDSGSAHAGLVVVPSSASSTNAKLAQTITNTFSDNVTVTPGSNGTTGVITPEFRTVKGHDFLYVLVPVKTGSTTNATSTQVQSN